MKTKTARSLGKGERTVLLPGVTAAEPWELWAIGGSGARCVQTVARPLDNRYRRTTTLALPVAQVFCLPLWLNATDSRQFAGIISLQLELRGLQPRASGHVVFDWAVVAEEGARTLALVAALPPSLPEEIQARSYSGFDLSARCFALPEDALTLWPEGDRLVFAMTRGAHLVYFQALGESRITARSLQDLSCVGAALTMQNVLTPLRRIVVWTDLPPADLASLRETLRLPVERAERPPPRLPAPAWKLIPDTVSQARKDRAARRWQFRGLLLFLALYLILVSGLVSRLMLTSSRVKELQRWQADHAADLALVHDTEAAWKDLEPVVAEKSYPLELLLHCAEAIPEDQLHLTLFEASDGHLLIKGEAKDVAAAFQFLDHLKQDPYFASYTWDMGQPHLLPNDLAQLQIEGTPAAETF